MLIVLLYPFSQSGKIGRWLSDKLTETFDRFCHEGACFTYAQRPEISNRLAAAQLPDWRESLAPVLEASSAEQKNSQAVAGLAIVADGFNQLGQPFRLFFRVINDKEET